jgi:lysylphosphatidylglycerol synthetase-like protein (DUF2156 family)
MTDPEFRVSCERWLRAGGVPAFVRGHARPSAVIRRPWSVVVSGLLSIGLIVVALQLAGFFDLPHGPWAYLVAAVGAVGLGYLFTALGLTSVLGFTLGFLLRTVWRSGSGLTHVLPLLLVAVVFTFLGAETWQSIGRLKGLPLVLTSLLIVAVALLMLRRRDGDADAGTSAGFGDDAAVRSTLPEALRADAPITGPAEREAPLNWGERVNIRMISVLGRVLVAAVIGLAIAGFFVVFGVLTVDAGVAASWAGAPPTVWWQVTIAQHTYSLTAEHVRVAVFLGVFSALYFIVAAASDRKLSATLSADADAHVRQCLAVRAVYLVDPVEAAGQP